VFPEIPEDIEPEPMTSLQSTFEQSSENFAQDYTMFVLGLKELWSRWLGAMAELLLSS
jgi:hypothetical protein